NSEHQLGSETRLAPGTWECLSRRCRSAIAHDVFDVAAAQADVCQGAIIKLPNDSNGVTHVLLVSHAACKLSNVLNVTAERSRNKRCGAAEIDRH
ncbi:MAG TPA: hypothetical protein VFP79_08045, partial [Pseudolabrys sp.]|nr:hypothetical protein [Pseudolabrys sp.]